MRRSTVLLLLSLITFSAQAQFNWWNQTHNWDGATPWTHYMTYSHAFLGPNALPIPTVAGAHRNYASSSAQISLRGDDQFVNWHNEVQLVSGKTLFNVVHQSVEAFRTTTDVRDLRASRGESGQGIQAGDVIVNISHRLYENNDAGTTEVYFTTHLKTAAGPLNNARFTDAPGYAFFFTGRWNPKYTRFWISSNAGFQVYQTHWVDYPQNDGFLGNVSITQRMDHGIGLQAELKTFTGYFRDGDWPRILNLSIDRNFGGKSRSVLQWTKGLNDYPFSYLSVTHMIFLDQPTKSPK